VELKPVLPRRSPSAHTGDARISLANEWLDLFQESIAQVSGLALFLDSQGSGPVCMFVSVHVLTGVFITPLSPVEEVRFRPAGLLSLSDLFEGLSSPVSFSVSLWHYQQDDQSGTD